jgi:hypothetical protein
MKRAETQPIERKAKKNFFLCVRRLQGGVGCSRRTTQRKAEIGSVGHSEKGRDGLVMPRRKKKILSVL